MKVETKNNKNDTTEDENCAGIHLITWKPVAAVKVTRQPDKKTFSHIGICMVQTSYS